MAVKMDEGEGGDTWNISKYSGNKRIFRSSQDICWKDICVCFVDSLDFVLICVYFVLLFFLLHICCVIVSTVGWI